MPSGGVQASEPGAPAETAGGVVRDRTSATDTPRSRTWVLWPWLVGLLLAAVASAGALALWGETPASPGPSAGQGVPVLSVPIERGDMMVRRRYPGELFADAVEVTSRIAGHVNEVPVRIGDTVEHGQILSRLDDAVLRRRVRETEAQIRAQRSITRTAAIAVEAAERDVARARGLVPSGALSRQELDELETAARQREAEQATAQARLEEARARLAVLKEDLSDTTIRAPFAGVVARRDVDAGAFVQPGMPLLRLVSENPLRVRFRVPEYELSGVGPGLAFDLETRQRSDVRSTGTVTRLSGEVTTLDRTLLVEGVVDRHEALRPGMYADVVLDVQQLEGVLTIPGAALVERIDASGHSSTGVFVVEGRLTDSLEDQRARWVDVRVLGRDGDRIAIDPGDAVVSLDEGVSVLVRGHRELADGTRVRLVDEGESEPS